LVCKSRAKQNACRLGEVKSFLDAGGLENLGGTRVAIVADSQVSLGAIVKGRSASPAANRLLKGRASCGAYARSADNHAHEPTRGHIEPPNLALNWNPAATGQFTGTDDFLEMYPFLHPEPLDKART